MHTLFKKDRYDSPATVGGGGRNTRAVVRPTVGSARRSTTAAA